MASAVFRVSEADRLSSDILSLKVTIDGKTAERICALSGYCATSERFGEKPKLYLVKGSSETLIPFSSRSTRKIQRKLSSKGGNSGACRFGPAEVALGGGAISLKIVSEDGELSCQIGQLECSELDFLIEDLEALKVITEADLDDLDQRFASLPDEAKSSLEGEFLGATLGLIRHKRTGPYEGQFFRLRRLAKRQNQWRVFRKFQTLVSAKLYPLVFDKHGLAFNFRNAPDSDSLWSGLRGVMTQLAQDYRPVFVVSGTLLGLVRSGDFIEHDDDIDLAMLLRAENEADAAREWAALKTTFLKAGLLNRYIQAQVPSPIMKLKEVGGISIDLFPAWIEDGKIFIYPHTHGELAENVVFPLRLHETKQVLMPAEPEPILQLNYGDGWRIPDPSCKLPWREWKTRYASFLQNRALKRWNK